MQFIIKLKALSKNKPCIIKKQSDGASGYDIYLSPDSPEIFLYPGQTKIFPTGIAFEMPRGIEAQIRPRSGLALKHNVTVLNSPGTIDSDYRGEVSILLINHGTEIISFKSTDRIAQIVFCPVLDVILEPSETLTTTMRGTNGFGSTGK